MRLVTFARQTDGAPSIGVVQGDRVSPLGLLADFYRDVDGVLAAARGKSSAELRLDELRLAVPVPPTAKVICAAINYATHGAESNLKTPPYPNLFARWTSTLVPDGTPIRIPASEPGRDGVMGMDWEVELGVIIGRRASAVSRQEAMRHVLGYVIFNDVSARRSQLEAFAQPNGQWGLGKNADESGPIGSFIVTADEIDGGNLTLATRVNGEVMQSASTSEMIFDIPALIEFASRTVTLQPGDLIATGTPQGCGIARKPPRFLQPGDVCELEIEGLGTLRNPLVADSLR